MNDPVGPGLRVRHRLVNLGFPRREMWDDPAWYTKYGGPRMERQPAPFIYNPAIPMPLEVQRAWHQICTERDAGKLQFTHAYEKAWRHAKRAFLWRNKAWKAPVSAMGEVLGAKETFNRLSWEAYRDDQAAAPKPKEDFRAFLTRTKINTMQPTLNELEMKLEIKEKADFGGVVHGRTVA